MKTGARTGFQNRVAPDCRAQDCNYLYLNNYTYYLYLNENSKILRLKKCPPPTINWGIKKLEYFIVKIDYINMFSM